MSITGATALTAVLSAGCAAKDELTWAEPGMTVRSVLTDHAYTYNPAPDYDKHGSNVKSVAGTAGFQLTVAEVEEVIEHGAKTAGMTVDCSTINSADLHDYFTTMRTVENGKHRQCLMTLDGDNFGGATIAQSPPGKLTMVRYSIGPNTADDF